MHLLGVMSGTSLDGIDFCYVEMNATTYAFNIISAETYPYPKNWEKILKSASTKSAIEVKGINVNYTQYLNEQIHQFIRSKNIKTLDLVASHGHTIWHKPSEGFTLQIGNKQALSKGFNIPVVCDFRVQDVKLGGQGAPLVPIGDQLLFSDFDYCLNLGGFSNISYEGSNRKRLAFDICPINTLLNHYTELYFEKPYDHQGHLARKGRVDAQLFNALNQIEYYQKRPPKSLGIEQVQAIYRPLIESFNTQPHDILCTLVEHMAYQIAKVLTLAHTQPRKVLVTGGGAYHQFLIERLQYYAQPNDIVIPNTYLVEYKEALIFALLGLLKWQGKNNVLSSVTGAKHDHSSGVIYH